MKTYKTKRSVRENKIEKKTETWIKKMKIPRFRTQKFCPHRSELLFEYF